MTCFHDPKSRACLLTVYGFETQRDVITNAAQASTGRACLLTVYGFETSITDAINPDGENEVVHASLPFTVLKLLENRGIKRAAPNSRACLLTVYGFETISNANVSTLFNTTKSCMPPYRLRF